MKTQTRKTNASSKKEKVKSTDEKINIITLGCSKNLVDSEVLMGQLKAGGKNVVHEEAENVREKSNIVIINTCGFIDRAKQESIDTILEYAEKKQNGDIEKLYVSGCLSERYAKELREEIPEVDAFFGTTNYDELVREFDVDYKHELIGERVLTTDTHYAYLKISEGCDRPCSFCAIPLMRGGHKSRTIESLVKEAHFLASRGVKEIMLIAQDLTYYGLDLYQKRNLSELLDHLANVRGIEWIRLHYTFPSGFPEDILPVMKMYPNICNYLDMPLQHAADSVLKSMRRGITREKMIQLIDRIREQIPDIALRTTMMVGYPGETQQDFDDLCDFISEIKFDRLGVFTYSHEENTHAFTLEDNVPQEIKQERFEELMSIQQDISLELNQFKIGHTFKTLVDRKEGDFYIGRTEYDSPEVDNEVIINPPKENQPGISIGQFYDIEIYDAHEFDLLGEIKG